MREIRIWYQLQIAETLSRQFFLKNISLEKKIYKERRIKVADTGY